MSYILNHWRGKLSLGVSLWINMLGLLIVISYVELYVLSLLTVSPVQLIKLSLISLFFTRLIVFPWQLIGLFRAIESDFLMYKNSLRTRGLQAFVLLLVVGNLVYSLELVQSAVFNKKQIELTSRVEEKEEYTLEVSADKKSLLLSGVISIGITAATRKLIEQNPGITWIELRSPGGQVYEGRGLAKLFIEHQLDTYVYKECASACVTAFIGGRKRFLDLEGRLGFHQYKLDATNSGNLVVFYDSEAEQERDRGLFKTRGIRKEFLEKMYTHHANEMWYPDYQELLEMLVISGKPPEPRQTSQQLTN